jgi:hypothetical protein
MNYISEQYLNERGGKELVYAIHKYGNLMHDLDNEFRKARGRKQLTKQERLKRQIELFKKRKSAAEKRYRAARDARKRKRRKKKKKKK